MADDAWGAAGRCGVATCKVTSATRRIRSRRCISAVESIVPTNARIISCFVVGSNYGGTMPLHIDRFVEIIFRTSIDDLDTQKVIDSDDKFEKLCRVISLTEQRGFRQVEILLNHPLVRDDKALMKIFAI